MRTALLIVAAGLFLSASAKERTVVLTSVDTIRVTQTWNDTSILVKQDTVVVKGSHKPVQKAK